MADYKELLRRAVDALPENNGAARRAVYEKARAALVGQLRAINPPLAARDITTHRLQLEDCIRQVEQEASEAVIAGMSTAAEEATPAPVYLEAEPSEPSEPAAAKPAESAPRQVRIKDSPKALPAGGSIEEIIAAANADVEVIPPKSKAEEPAETTEAEPAAADDENEAEAGHEAEVLSPKPAKKQGGRSLPSIVARAEAAKGRSAAAAFGLPQEKPYDAPRRGPTLEVRREAARAEPVAHGGRQAAMARELAEPQTLHDGPAVATAMSAVREVEVEPQQLDPQGDIDRAIATLDREARGETQPVPDDDAPEYDDTITLDDEDEPAFAPSRNGAADMFAGERRREKAEIAESLERPRRRQKPTRERSEPRLRDDGPADARSAEAPFPRARLEDDRGGMSAVTIFLAVLVVLLIGAGGAGYWAVSQGYVDLGSMFRSETPVVADAEAAEPAAPEPDGGSPATGPGNTATPVAAEPATELQAGERLVPEPSLTGDEPETLVAPGVSGKSEERLGDTSSEAAANAEAAVASIDPETVAGSQSLLLEDSDDADTGAVPFSGTVEWSKGTDETGLPTLVATAKIPARNLGVNLLIRKNQDPALPASHLMEINFSVSDGFIGGSIAGLPGVLLKNEELVQGTPLIGPAGVRVVANSFLFALSASEEDATTNTELLTTRKWMDLFVIYATGKRAILTLEKDEEAQALFAEVFEAWGDTTAAEPAEAEAAEETGGSAG